MPSSPICKAWARPWGGGGNVVDMGVFRGVLTAVLFGLFVALVLWAYSRKRHDDFARLAQLPLEDDSAPPAGKESR